MAKLPAPRKVKPRLFQGGAVVWIHSRDDRNGGPERGNLGEGEGDENNAALDDMNAEIGVNPGEDEARDKGRQQEGRDFHS
jgi:hypothetical protein